MHGSASKEDTCYCTLLKQALADGLQNMLHIPQFRPISQSFSDELRPVPGPIQAAQDCSMLWKALVA